MKIRIVLSATLAMAALAPAGARAQTELDRLGQRGGFFYERAGTPTRHRARPQEHEDAADDEDDDVDIEWHHGLISIDADQARPGAFCMEFNHQTGIPAHLASGTQFLITGKVKNVSLERALDLVLPKGTWQLVRKQDPALRAEESYVGLVLHPAGPVEGTGSGIPHAHLGGTNFGPTFEVPGAPTQPAAHAIAEEPGDPADGAPPAAAPQAAPAPETSAPHTAGDDAMRRRIAELMEQRVNRKR